MRRFICASLIALTPLLFPSSASADDWGLHNGDTLQQGDKMPYAEIGWPGIDAGFQYGVTSWFDAGVRLSIPSFAWENTTITSLGLAARVPLRVGIYKTDRVSAMLHVDPGIKVYFDECGYFYPYYYDCGPTIEHRALVGLTAPFGVDAGVRLSPDWSVDITFEMPIDMLFLERGPAISLTPLAGTGFEYHASPHFGIGLNGRAGPVIFQRDAVFNVAFAFTTQFAFIFHLSP
jgi:hypothetical protein